MSSTSIRSTCVEFRKALHTAGANIDRNASIDSLRCSESRQDFRREVGVNAETSNELTFWFRVKMGTLGEFRYSNSRPTPRLELDTYQRGSPPIKRIKLLMNSQFCDNRAADLDAFQRLPLSGQSHAFSR